MDWTYKQAPRAKQAREGMGALLADLKQRTEDARKTMTPAGRVFDQLIGIGSDHVNREDLRLAMETATLGEVDAFVQRFVLHVVMLGDWESEDESKRLTDILRSLMTGHRIVSEDEGLPDYPSPFRRGEAARDLVAAYDAEKLLERERWEYTKQLLREDE